MKWFVKPIFKIAFGLSRVPLSEIIKQDMVTVEGSNLKYNIKEFTVIVLYKETGTFKTVLNKSEKLNDATKKLFYQMKPEDSMIFQSIVAIDPNGKEIDIDARTFTVR